MKPAGDETPPLVGEHASGVRPCPPTLADAARGHTYNPKINDIEYTWADIEIKVAGDGLPDVGPCTTVPGVCEYDAVLEVRSDLPDIILGELLNAGAVLPPGLLEKIMPLSPEEREVLKRGPYVCVRLFDAHDNLLPRPTPCLCNTLDCPHRPAKDS